MLKAYWDGNNTLHWLNSTVNLALIPDSAGNVFSVVSNSTVSNFAYNSTTQELSFNTNGTSSTTGYANICIPKALVDDIQTLQVSKDGQPIAFGIESQGRCMGYLLRVYSKRTCFHGADTFHADAKPNNVSMDSHRHSHSRINRRCSHLGGC